MSSCVQRHLLCTGALLQTKASQQDNPEVEVARCSKGQYFGELALVTNKPRAVSVYAVGDTKCLGMLQMIVYLPLLTSRGDKELWPCHSQQPNIVDYPEGSVQRFPNRILFTSGTFFFLQTDNLKDKSNTSFCGSLSAWSQHVLPVSEFKNTHMSKNMLAQWQLGWAPADHRDPGFQE